MMTTVFRIFLILGILGYFIVIFKLLKNKSLNLKYSLLWIFSGVMMFIIAVFPVVMDGIASLLGIASVVNAVFVIALFFLIMIVMSLTSIVSKQNEKMIRLIQSVALLEKRIETLEEQVEKE